MFHPRTTLFAFALAAVACGTNSEGTSASSSSSSALECPVATAAITKLLGNYDGAWTMTGIDANGAPKVLLSWTDTVAAANPIYAADRVYFEAVDHMVYPDGARPVDTPWKEGFLLNADGSLGDHYFEISGQTVLEHTVGDGVFSFAQTASAGELAWLGFPNATFGNHVTTKVVGSNADGSETEHVTRLTTVHWTDATGADRWSQVVTMQGTHHHTL